MAIPMAVNIAHEHEASAAIGQPTESQFVGHKPQKRSTFRLDEEEDTLFSSELGENDSGLGQSPSRKKRKWVQFEPVVTCHGSPNQLESRDLKEDTSYSTNSMDGGSCVEEDGGSCVEEDGGGCVKEDGGGCVKEGVIGVETCVKSMSDEMKLMLSKWKETFNESESFEQFCPVRIDELSKQALALEQTLLKQKEVLKARLVGISQTLKPLQ